MSVFVSLGTKYLINNSGLGIVTTTMDFTKYTRRKALNGQFNWCIAIATELRRLRQEDHEL